MSPLDPRIAFWFGDDERADQSWALLHQADKAHVERIAFAAGDDPGRLPADQFLALGGDARRRRVRALEQWHKALPYIQTKQTKDVVRQITTLPAPRPATDTELLDVPLITGPPGSGKTFLLKRLFIRALCESARDRRLELEDTPPRNQGLIIDDWRPALFRSMDGNLRPAKFFALLCNELGAPCSDDPQRDFERAVARHGVQWLFLDEMQMVNFDGQYGRYLQDALKALQNMGIRVVLCGHNMRNMLGRQRTSAQLAAREQLIARAAFLDIGRYRREDEKDIKEWKSILRKIEARLRLSGHNEGERVLSATFEQYLWVSTLGYMNALSTLITKATKAAALSPAQRLSEELFSDVRLNERVEPGRQQRLRQWREGTFLWSTDVRQET